MGGAWSEVKDTGEALKRSTKAAFGGRYEPPPRQGDYPWTRSGLPPPRLQRGEHGNENASMAYRKDQMNLGLHTVNERQRVRHGYTQVERELRKQYVMDQRLHPDEPIRIDAIYRQLNPIRKIYRMPMDWAYTKMLPRLGIQWAHYFRVWPPKVVLAWLGGCALWYHVKYNRGDWTMVTVTNIEQDPYVHPRYDELEKMEPGIHAKAFHTARWIHPDDKERDPLDWGQDWFNLWLEMVLKGDPGPSKRPW